ncbi:MAG: c-type cytochrome [Planctomycetes bacterium]|nr:c-type cytochrome [Planctomycetota bacterium]
MSGEKLAIIGLPALALIMLVVGFVAAPAADVDPEIDADQPFDKELAGAYVKAGCWQCHSVSTLKTELAETFGAEAAGVRPLGPDLAGVGERYHPQWHEAHFWQPDAIYHGSQMPAQRQLFTREAQPKLTEQGKDVIAFLMTLKAPSGINKPWPEGPHTAPEGNANQGAVLFMRECTGCHGVQGMGVGPAARFFKSLRKPPAFASDQLIFLQVADTKLDSIYTMITNGVPGSAMPGFGNRLTDQERADLAAYVAKLGGYD